MNKNRFVKIAVFLTIVTLVFTTTNQAMTRMNNDTDRDSITFNSANNYYTWQDNFNNAQNIDKSYSENYVVENGKVSMKGTYSQWTDPSFTRMKQISINSNKVIENCILKIIVEYDTDMRGDYGDLRFKSGGSGVFLSYWIEEKNPIPNDPYAIVWLKIPSLPSGNSYVYMFYGNPSATDQSDYWSVFDQNSWQKRYTHDHRVTYRMETEGAWDPDVTWGNNKFLVTWEEGIPRYLPLGMIFKQQIRGCFYDENGNQVGSRFDITPWDDNPLTPFRCENPASAYGQSGSTKNFFVAYEYYNSPNDVLSRDIKGAIVPTNTNNINDVTLFDICTAAGNQADPQVTYDPGNNRFFVIWEDARGGTNNYNIYGRFFDLNGNAIGSEKMITNRPNSQVEPWITFDNVNNHYMIVWEEGINAAHGPFEIWGQLFTVDGNTIGNAKRLSAAGSSNTDYVFPCVEFCSLSQRFLVTWQEANIGSGEWFGHIWGKILDKNGNVAVDIFKIDHGKFERTSIAPYLSTSFFVAYDDNGEIWGKLVSSEGEVTPYVLQLSTSGSDKSDWANIASSGQKIFVAWEDTRLVYPEPYESLNLPDIYANVWSFSIASSSEVSYSFSEEKTLILQAHIVSTKIEPTNWQSWHKFYATKSGSVVFDVLDGDTLDVLKAGVTDGADIQSISKSPIRLKASFSRNNPSSTPTLSVWKVTYQGQDTVPPRTTLNRIEGVKGLNDWYTSESVIIWLHAQDYPEDTGSGVDKTYYSLNSGQPQEYNSDSGLQVSATQQSNWLGHWDVNFWSVDNSGNVEDKNKAQNKISIKIDAERPYVELTEPANEQKVNVPFWVRASATDNGVIDRVEFDIEPFGEREGLPYAVYEPPYEWYCDVEYTDSIIKALSEEPQLAGVNVMVRAQVFDESGQSWLHEVWVFVENWNKSRDRSMPRLFESNFLRLFRSLKLGINIKETLDVSTPAIQDSDRVVFKAESIFTRREFISVDYNPSDGCFASFDIPTGFYKITACTYKYNEQIASEVIARVFYFKK